MTDLEIITQLEDKIQKLPPQIVIEVNDYVDFLLQKYQNDSQKPSKKPLGTLKNFCTLNPEVHVSNGDLIHQQRDAPHIVDGETFEKNLTKNKSLLGCLQHSRYSQALLETLAIIAHRQPITREEIEQLRGVSVIPAILKTLADYQWIRIIAYKEAHGKSAMYVTTRHFLDHFGLKNLSDLSPLTELQDLFAPVDILHIVDDKIFEKNLTENKSLLGCLQHYAHPESISEEPYAWQDSLGTDDDSH